MKLSKQNEDLVQVLIEGAQQTFRNAEELFSEATLLGRHGATARAYFLHQISLEECGKVEMIGTGVTQLLMGLEVDMHKLMNAFKRHKSKNYMNAYFLPRSDKENIAIKNNDIQAALLAFEDLQKKFHFQSNNLKNDSLYVDYKQKFIAPSDIINPDDLDRICKCNSEFMGLTQVKVEMLRRWSHDLSSPIADLNEFRTLSESINPNTDNLDTHRESVKDVIRKMAQSRIKYPKSE
ncbi:AbiV family abortive infection protein [Chitinimonas sp. PSY-7]|uniref:AbiV family abortive infection protein n=1 Tax=Chitinimonas sp. PSY-7 TaxID=3459088 RepID=UPI0040400BB8